MSLHPHISYSYTYPPDTTTTCLISGITRGQCTPQRTLTTSGHPPRYSLFLPRLPRFHLIRAHIWPGVVVVTRALAEMRRMMMIYGPDPLPYHYHVVCYCYCPQWPCRRNHSHSSLSSAARMAGDRWATGFSWAINQILQTFARPSVSIVRRRNPLHRRAGGYPYRTLGLGPANLCTGNSRPHFRQTAAAVVVVHRTRQRGRMTGRHRLFRLRSCRCPQPTRMMMMGVLPFSAGGSRIVCEATAAAAVAGSGYTFD